MSPTFAYLIGFVVILWVVLEHLWLLCVVEVPHEIVYPEVLSPLLAFREPADYSAMDGERSLIL